MSLICFIFETGKRLTGQEIQQEIEQTESLVLPTYVNVLDVLDWAEEGTTQ